MKASTKIMSSAKATTRHAIRAIMGDVNSETEMVGLVNSVTGSHVELFNSPIACSYTPTSQTALLLYPVLKKALCRSQHTIGLIPQMQLVQVPYTQIKHGLV